MLAKQANSGDAEAVTLKLAAACQATTSEIGGWFDLLQDVCATAEPRAMKNALSKVKVGRNRSRKESNLENLGREVKSYVIL